MSFGNIIGQLLQQGMASQTRSRLERTTGSKAQGGGLDQMLGGLLGGLGSGSPSGGGSGGLGGAGGASQLDGLLGLAKQYMGNKQAGNLTGAQVGGIGALAGALLGGGKGAAKGALGGSAMAILGTLALNALQARMANQASGAGTAPAQLDVSQAQLQTMVDPATERLVLRAMISAAKADGEVDEEEMSRIVGKIGVDGVTPEERQLVLDELRRPLDIASLVSEVPNPLVAAEVYAASLLAIDVNTADEIAYLKRLAQALRLDAQTVARLHEMTGLPK